MDFAKISVLLDVIHKAVGAGPQFAWVLAQAQQALDKEREASQPDLNAQEAAKKKADEDRAKWDAENTVLAKAAAARARVDQVGQDKVQAEEDAKVLAEADRITKQREAMTKAHQADVAKATAPTPVPPIFPPRGPGDKGYPNV